MSWFTRLKQGISTATKSTKQLKENFHKCIKCNFHTRVSSEDYFNILFDEDYVVYFENLESYDFLEFTDIQAYSKRLEDARQSSGKTDSITVAYGKVNGSAMDFTFIGGSMGSVMGEKISRAIDLAIHEKVGLMIISKSGGARMMEAAFSLMQMAKTSAKLTQLAKAKLPYFSFLTDPTTGGVTASFAMLGDINFSEPNALIGFAGPRVVKETIKRDLPDGFQRSEFLLENGFLDFIIDRSELKQTVGDLLVLFKSKM